MSVSEHISGSVVGSAIRASICFPCLEKESFQMIYLFYPCTQCLLWSICFLALVLSNYLFIAYRMLIERLPVSYDFPLELPCKVMFYVPFFFVCL